MQLTWKDEEAFCAAVLRISQMVETADSIAADKAALAVLLEIQFLIVPAPAQRSEAEEIRRLDEGGGGEGRLSGLRGCWTVIAILVRILRDRRVFVLFASASRCRSRDLQAHDGWGVDRPLWLCMPQVHMAVSVVCPA